MTLGIAGHLGLDDCRSPTRPGPSLHPITVHGTLIRVVQGKESRNLLHIHQVKDTKDGRRKISVPALDYQAQANLLFLVAFVPDPVTGLHTVVRSTPLRWLLYNVEKVLFVDYQPSAKAEITSDPESTCPVCEQKYFTTPSGAADTTTTTKSDHQERVQNERPLELRCGHVVGRTCLHRILAHDKLQYRLCPVCEDPIYVCRFIDTVLIPTYGTGPDVLALIRRAVRLYILIGESSRPETHEGLRSWMKSPLFAQETGLGRTRIAWMTAAIDVCDEVGESGVWELMRSRARKDFRPN